RTGAAGYPGRQASRIAARLMTSGRANRIRMAASTWAQAASIHKPIPYRSLHQFQPSHIRPLIWRRESTLAPWLGPLDRDGQCHLAEVSESGVFSLGGGAARSLR